MTPRLRRVDCDGPGIERRRRGRGWEYRHADGRPVNAIERARIAALAIPPAWRDVWICADPRGHLQAIGTDAAGRRQYRYHDGWRVHRDRQKFEHMERFAEALPPLREHVAARLEGDGADRERVLAAMLRLLDLGFFRIGSEEYAERNDSYGLATMRKEHVVVARDDTIRFDYTAKHGRRRVQSVVDPVTAELVRMLRRRRGGGEELFAYRVGRRWVDVRSEDVNVALKALAGEEFSAKDFRTWNATVLAAVALAVLPRGRSRTARRRVEAHAIKEVAHYLGNTPAVCRASYVDPRVFDRHAAGLTIRDAVVDLQAPSQDLRAAQGEVEIAVLDLLADEPRRRARAA